MKTNKNNSNSNEKDKDNNRDIITEISKYFNILKKKKTCYTRNNKIQMNYITFDEDPKYTHFKLLKESDLLFEEFIIEKDLLDLDEAIMDQNENDYNTDNETIEYANNEIQKDLEDAIKTIYKEGIDSIFNVANRKIFTKEEIVKLNKIIIPLNKKMYFKIQEDKQKYDINDNKDNLI